MTIPPPPAALRRAVSRLSTKPRCTCLGSLQFDAEFGRWILTLLLDSQTSTEYVASRTQWKVMIDAGYPLGDVDVFPSATNGLTATFPHQLRNSRGPERRSWRAGKLCLDSPFGTQRLASSDRDPVGDGERRLEWHVDRALDWIDAATTDTLLNNGDPFELPHRSFASRADFKFKIVHDETSASFGIWAGRLGTCGTVRLRSLPGIEDVLVAAAFVDGDGQALRTWSGRASEMDANLLGIWWLWPRPAVMPPWESPTTWRDFREVGRGMGIDVDRELRNASRRLRPRKQFGFLLLGYPIPKRIGDAPSEIHWDAYILPKLVPQKAPNGFRNNESGWWMQDRRTHFADSAKPTCVPAENWTPDRLQARGRLPEEIRSRGFAVLGAGALGSAVAEALVRAGVAKVALLDPDVLSAGNVCRHFATLNDVGSPKVEVVGRKLQAISPHVIVKTMQSDTPNTEARLHENFADYDVIVDCTASSDALEALAAAWWPVPRRFISLSLGYGGRRLFAFAATDHSFPAKQFSAEIEPWLMEERALWSKSGEVLEGAGCWSPLFPARFDDILIAAGIGIKEIERLFSSSSQPAALRVFDIAGITNAPLSATAIFAAREDAK